MIASNIRKIQQKMAAIPRGGRSSLMAVSKKQSPEAVREALLAGQRLFGENRVQEAEAKFPRLRAAFPDLELHLIGPLQTNKTARAVAFFDGIQTVDRPALAFALGKEIRKQGRTLRLYIEVNIGLEPQKAGVAPQEAGSFLELCRKEAGLAIEGLMAIPPANEDPVPYFKAMEALRDRLGLVGLSMGMSADYEEALRHGATLVRVGEGIFGARKKP